ncbi:P-loop containing nucleoside triphosphate hydrolase protein [Mycena floridula]|nr:P-loop containing nucleoside triphosphate hydrolase protein [Mycena floridula]
MTEPNGNADVSPDVPDGKLLLEWKRILRLWNEETGIWTIKDHVSDEVEADLNHAFVMVREYKPAYGGIPSSESYKIHIRSPQFIKAAKVVLCDVPDVAWESYPVTFDRNSMLGYLRLFEAYLKELKTSDKQEDTPEIQEHLAIFITFLYTECASILSELHDLLDQNLISFKLAWGMYLPGTILYNVHPISGDPCAVRLLSVEFVCRSGEPRHWNLEVEYLDSNTKGIGFARRRVKIEEFVGNSKIQALNAYPLDRSDSALLSRLKERGEKWIKTIRQVAHMQYDYLAFEGEMNDYRWIRGFPPFYKKVQVQGRIMIDKEMYELYTHVSLRPDSIRRYVRSADASLPPSFGNEDDILLATPVVYGFSFSYRKYVVLSISEAHDIKWNNETFPSLDLEEGQKELVHALVDSHMKSRSLEDYVSAKGVGLVFNLHGPPGVGKTLTAEAVSEAVKCPLYMVGAGDLGTTAEALDEELNKIFAAASAWRAIVLIDEADVFLEQRSADNLQRNAMIAVFLRQIEYFTGILILTSNRIEVFDQAMESRIHVSINYQNLSEATKGRLWEGFFQRAGLNRDVVKSTEFQSLVADLRKKPFNGREIKNVVKSALALARHRNQELSQQDIIQVVALMEKRGSIGISKL